MHSGMAIPSNSADSWFIDTQAGISWQQTFFFPIHYLAVGTKAPTCIELGSNFVIICDMLIRILTLEFSTTMGT